MSADRDEAKPNSEDENRAETPSEAVETPNTFFWEERTPGDSKLKYSKEQASRCFGGFSLLVFITENLKIRYKGADSRGFAGEENGSHSVDLCTNL